jgi:PAS domain S-box-containing protein
MEQQLEQSEEKFRTHLRDLPVGFFRTDLAGNLLEANPEMGRIFGFEDRTSLFSVINKTVLPMYPDPPQREGLIEELQASYGTLQRRVAMKKIDGSAFPATLTIRLIRDESGKPLYLQGLIEDVSERERMYEMMVESEKFLTVAGLAAGMAHEINNPLGIIIQTAENLERRLLGDLPANDSAAAASGLTMEGIRTYARHRGIDTYISDISVAVNRAARIVTNMLQFSRKNEKQTGPCDVEAVIDKAIDLAGTDYSLKRRYDFKRIRIIRVRANPPPVRCLESQLEQVLFNLLRNAAEAMAGMESLDRKPAIRIVTFLEERWVGIEIEDNGPGMDEETMRRIFEPFFTTNRGRGNGPRPFSEPLHHREHHERDDRRPVAQGRVVQVHDTAPAGAGGAKNGETGDLRWKKR